MTLLDILNTNSFSHIARMVALVPLILAVIVFMIWINWETRYDTYKNKYKLAKGLYIEGKYDKAQEVLDEALYCKPDSGEALMLMAKIDLQKRDCEGAKKYLQKAMKTYSYEIEEQAQNLLYSGNFTSFCHL